MLVLSTVQTNVTTHTSDYRTFLRQEYLTRKERNASYSLRAYSRQLGISKTALVEVLAQKRNLSSKNALKVAERLGLSPEATKKMLTEIRGLSSPNLDSIYHTLDEDSFNVISEWYHYAILNLAKLKRHKADPQWIAKRLGITSLEARSAILRLERMDFLEVKSNKLHRKVGSLSTTEAIPSAALRKFHKQNLLLAISSIERDGIDERYNTSITMAIDSSRLISARKLFLRFRDRMCAFLESENPDSVYTLGMQLFPVVRKENRKRR
jgi:uncharacterized protein (TIGR02147 family)